MQELHFRERFLKPYAEPVSASELKQGEAYFSVCYVDDDGFVSLIESLVFVGENLEPEDEGRRFYFQDLKSYHAGAKYNSGDEGDAHFYAKKTVNHIFEYENALNELLRCSLRRDKLRTHGS